MVGFAGRTEGDKWNSRRHSWQKGGDSPKHVLAFIRTELAGQQTRPGRARSGNGRIRSVDSGRGALPARGGICSAGCAERRDLEDQFLDGPAEPTVGRCCAEGRRGRMQVMQFAQTEVAPLSWRVMR